MFTIFACFSGLVAFLVVAKMPQKRFERQQR
jgi:hypothetical protein